MGAVVIPYNTGWKNVSGYDSVLAMLEDAKSEFITGSVKPNKAVLIILDDTNKDEYRTRYFNAGMNCSELITLLEIKKMDIYSIMRDVT